MITTSPKTELVQLLDHLLAGRRLNAHNAADFGASHDLAGVVQSLQKVGLQFTISSEIRNDANGGAVVVNSYLLDPASREKAEAFRSIGASV